MVSDSQLIIGFITLFVGVVVLTIISPVAMIDTGEIGIVSQFGRATNTLEPGMHFKIPIYESVTTMNTRVKKVELSCDAASSDMQSMKALVSVNYRIDSRPEQVLELFKTMGLNYEETVIKPTVQSSTKAGTAEFTSSTLLTNRVLAQERIEEIITERLDGQGFIITQVNLVNVDFSDEFDQAIEAKLQKEQEVKKEEQELRLIEIQAQQKIVQAEAQANATITEARAEAEAMRLKQSSLTDKIVGLEWIKKWNGELPETMLGDSEVLMTVK